MNIRGLNLAQAIAKIANQADVCDSEFDAVHNTIEERNVLYVAVTRAKKELYLRQLQQ